MGESLGATLVRRLGFLKTDWEGGGVEDHFLGGEKGIVGDHYV
jgi:hypothetical protein